jgi:hypothetical protein
MKSIFLGTLAVIGLLLAPQVLFAEEIPDPTPPPPSTSGTGGGLIYCSGSFAPGWNVSVDGGGCEGIEKRGTVLGSSTETPLTCTPYMTDYLHIGRTNSPEQVRKLQTFLNKHMGAGLTVSGTFDNATFAAVGVFQKKYPTEVLVPWKISYSTGYVYITTLKQINALECASS